jgi:hypothetical protein
MRSHLYKETQKVRQPWIYTLLVAVFGLWMWQLVQQVIMDVPFGTNPSPDWAILLIGLIPLGAFVLIFLMKLETVVDSSGIHYRMWPIHKKFRHINAADISRWEVKKYHPIRDYGGWGIRQGFGRKGVAFNMSGNMGALFELTSGKKIMIGTKKPEELRSALRKINLEPVT